MSKLILQSNLSLVAKSNEKAQSSLHGIYRNENGYIVSFCHGDRCGELALRISGEDIVVTPYTIRKTIFERLGVKIPDREKILIYPCFPKRVRHLYKDSFKKNNIKIICNNWDGETGSIFGTSTRDLETYTFVPSGKLIVVVGKYSTMRNIDRRNMLSETVKKL